MRRKSRHIKSRHEHVRALVHRAGTVDVAVAVDTRMKTIQPKKGWAGYRRKAKHRAKHQVDMDRCFA